MLSVQARVLLASTKAAGMGLNLTCACRAIIMDVWWNGAFEDQVAAASPPNAPADRPVLFHVPSPLSDLVAVTAR